MPEIANRSKHDAKEGTASLQGRRTDMEVVGILLNKCKTPADVMKIARKLRSQDGWREEFALYGEAATRFPEHKNSFLLARQGMAVNRKIQTFTEMERAGILKPSSKEKLLRIKVEA